MLSPLRLDIDPLPEASPWLIDENLVKKHCRITEPDEDDNLQIYISAAILWAENTTHRTIIRRQHRWTLRDFPGADGFILLPRGKTASVDGIEYTSGGTVYDLTGPSAGSPSGADYQEDLASDAGAVLMPLRGSSWPSVDTDVPAPVVVSFTAGWAAADIPSSLLHAILFATSDAYDMRNSGDYSELGGAGKSLQLREALVSPYRLIRWY